MRVDELRSTCEEAVGKRIAFRGKNGDERDPVNHGKWVSGVGLCKEFHDSHGLYILVERDDGRSEIVVDPIQVIIL